MNSEPEPILTMFTPFLKHGIEREIAALAALIHAQLRSEGIWQQRVWRRAYLWIAYS